ncbi:21934_t:CDS:2, partial [Gigaspora rosea]
EDSIVSSPYWLCEEKGLNVVHFWHNKEFTNVHMSAKFRNDIESLRELNSRLVLKIDELRKKYTEIEAENTELKGEKTVFLAKEAELMARIVELEQSAKENAENSKLRDSELNELRSRVSKLEQKQLKNNIVHRLKDGDNSFENVNVPDPAINQCIDTNTELLEDKEMIDFLDEKNKKRLVMR